MFTAKYFNSLSKRDQDAWRRLLAVKDIKPTESLADYIARTSVKTETRTSKRGVSLTKVFFEDGSIKEYQTEHLSTTYAF